MCGSPRPFARAVGGCAGAVRWERLPRVLEAVKTAGCGRTDILLSGRPQPCRLCRKHAHCGCELEVDMYQRIAVLYSPENGDSTKTHLSFNQQFTSHSKNEIPGQTRNDNEMTDQVGE